MSTEQNADLAVTRAPGIAAWRPWYMVAVLTVLAMYAQIDRGALVLLVGPIKQDLGMTDTQMSLLLGLSFATFFALLGLPAGYLVDRVSRRGVMGVGVLLWSSMTLSCGLAHSYWQLFLGRSGVGIGEAAITPASYSLIRDAFPPEKRGRAFGIFTAGTYMGSAANVLLTGLLIGFIASGGIKFVPWIGTMKVWQAVLVLTGAVGIPLSLIVLTFREPLRAPTGTGVAYGEAFAHIKAQWRTYLPLVVWATCFFAIGSADNSWIPSLIIRTWQWSPQQIGMVLGSELLVCAPIGAWIGGAMIDRLTRRGRRDAAIVVGIWVTTLFIPFAVASTIVPEINELWVALGAQLLIASAYQPVAASILAQATPQRLMGKVTAIYLLVFTLVGLGFGPTLVAVISDNFFAGPRAIGYALSVATACLMALALVMGALLIRRARQAA